MASHQELGCADVQKVNLQKLTDSLTDDEGARLSPYRDSLGRWTFGIGRCLETNPLTGAEWKWLLDNHALAIGLTDPGSQFLFGNDERMATTQIKARCDFWEQLDDMRQNILIEMCFQMGIEKLFGPNGFHKMFAALRIGDWKEARAQGLDSEWARKDSPARAEKLMNSLEIGSWP